MPSPFRNRPDQLIKPMGNSYTATEIAAVQQLYPFAPASDVKAALPGRTWGSIQAVASLLEVRRTIRDWPPAMLDIMRADYPTKGAAYVANLTGKSYNAVMKRAELMGIKRIWAGPKPRIRPERAPKPKKERPAKVAKAPKPVKTVVVVAPKPKPAPMPLPVRKRPGTPNLHTQKLKSRVPKPGELTEACARIKRLPGNHPERLAMNNGIPAWRAYLASQAA